MVEEKNQSVFALAEKIVNGAKQISSAQVSNASYDKTYLGTIMGINRLFTEAVPESVQTKIIDNHGIPEEPDADAENFYTVNIAGQYYCKQQKGSFRLYDEVKVYVPNNDWQNFYFDTDGSDSGNEGEIGNGSTDLPNVFVGVKAPDADCNEYGDFWIVTSDANATAYTELTPYTILKVYRYLDDDALGIRRWISIVPNYYKDVTAAELNIDDYWFRVDTANKITKIYQCTTATASERVYSELVPKNERGRKLNVKVSTESPMKEGDYWIEIDDEKDREIEALWKYKIDDKEKKLVWNLVYNSYMPRVFSQHEDPSNPADPTKKLKVRKGDYWIEIDDSEDKSFVNAWRWKINEQGKGEWELLCSASGGGGGGGNVNLTINYAILVQQEDVV